MAFQHPAFVAGAFEHPTRHAPDKSTAQLHAECARGALADAGLSLDDVDGYFCAADAPGGMPALMADYLNLRKLRHVDGTESGGCSYIAHVGHAADAIARGKCSVALITLAGKPRSSGQATGTEIRQIPPERPAAAFEQPYAWTVAGMYGLLARRHMHEYGTTMEQLAWVKVAASHHAQHNPHALLRKRYTTEDVLGSPLVADPLRRMDCCVITDGGGALVLVAPHIAASLARPRIGVRGYAETIRTNEAGRLDLLQTGAAITGARAFEMAGLAPADVKYASVYDNFTIMVALQLEDLGFCPKGQGGRFVADGNLISGVGRLPWNTDGGGMCNNHPQNRGGITKVIEAVRQLRGEAHPAVQVPSCDIALATGPGLVMGAGHAHATVLLERI
ncbi:acetyl-CoA acetyltransferase [Bordetella bronchiseptica]|uniref:Acetyl-CoA acetyltransferase n=1 Tax=Bordetella genomosp. 6 TaxID=463024 RepID=A0ABX4F727_9BORD|nr:thiolase domain-containing protein [Bordetella genomosp. 6]MBN3267899.1 acetyl-CoA acetyltransferase [Bordetella bronchiseptica]OZI70077.1 acetyl-CoA acetyltransferase [Bordetella genomosp. 6]